MTNTEAISSACGPYRHTCPLWTTCLFILFHCLVSHHVIVVHAVSTDVDLLMIGNGNINDNNMDAMVKELLEEGLSLSNEDVFTRRFTKPGAQLQDHVPNIPSALVARSWTWVILQEQSQTPGFWETAVENIFEDSLDAVITLDQMILDNGASTVLFMTWAHRFGDTRNPILYPDFPTMQDRIAEGYYRYRNYISTDERPVKIAPVGLAFEIIYDTLTLQGLDPTAEGTLFSDLYIEDGTRPSREGSYLAACVIYSTLTGKDPQELDWGPYGITDEMKIYLQSVAYVTVSNFEQNDPISREQDASPPPQNTEIAIDIEFDNFSNEIGWRLVDVNRNETLIDYSPGHYPWYLYARRTVEETVTVPEGGAYRLIITDSYGDGLCCSYGNGFYVVSIGGADIMQPRSQFGFEESIDFTT